MGLLVNKSLVHHLLVENAYENNLLSDISKMDYRYLLTTSTYFAIYVQRMLWKNEELCLALYENVDYCIQDTSNGTRNHGSQTRQGDKASHWWTPTYNIHAQRNVGSAIRSTITKIERDADGIARKRWKEIYTVDPYSLFVAKATFLRKKYRWCFQI